jgi:AsmA protein
MKEKNRTLSIEGTPTLRLFPVAGIALGKTSLSEPGSDKVFVSLESAEIAVRTMPLLSREVAIEILKISGLKANLVRRKDGTMNFADLAGPTDKDKKPEAPPNLRVAGGGRREGPGHVPG